MSREQTHSKQFLSSHDGPIPSFHIKVIPSLHTGLFFLILLILPIQLSCLAGAATAQNRVRILQSDRLEGTATDEGRIRKLTGNVHLKTDDFSMVCDSAWQFLDLDELRAFGNIEIITDRERIWSDKATYDLVSEVTLFEGRVILQSEKALLFSEQVFYSFPTEIALFPERMRLEDERGVLLADSGYYYNLLDSAVFRGNVQAADSLQYMEADSMFTRRGDEYYELHGRVFLDDQNNRTRLTGAFILSDSTGYRRVEGGARMRQVSEDQSDTTWLRAEWLEVLRKDTVRSFTAYDQVHIWSASYSSISDTSHYDEQYERITHRGDARLWYDEMQLTGPLIMIQLEQDSIRSLKAPGTPFAVQRDSASGRLNQITGDTLLILFSEAKISRMDVFPAANVLYFIKDDDEQPEGALEIRADHIEMIFEDGELKDVSGRRNVEGTYHPEEEGLAARRIDGFRWEPEERPGRPVDPIEPRLEGVQEDRPFPLPRRFTVYMDR